MRSGLLLYAPSRIVALSQGQNHRLPLRPCAAPIGAGLFVQTAYTARALRPKALDLYVWGDGVSARRCSSVSNMLMLFVARLSVSTLKYRILRHPVDPALGARSHPSC